MNLPSSKLHSVLMVGIDVVSFVLPQTCKKGNSSRKTAMIHGRGIIPHQDSHPSANLHVDILPFTSAPDPSPHCLPHPSLHHGSSLHSTTSAYSHVALGMGPRELAPGGPRSSVTRSRHRPRHLHRRRDPQPPPSIGRYKDPMLCAAPSTRLLSYRNRLRRLVLDLPCGLLNLK